MSSAAVVIWALRVKSNLQPIWSPVGYNKEVKQIPAISKLWCYNN